MKWIPIEEQYPSPKAPIILTVTAEDGGREVELGYVNTTGGVFTLQHAEVTSRVVAWMPLPEPYRG